MLSVMLCCGNIMESSMIPKTAHIYRDKRQLTNLLSIMSIGETAKHLGVTTPTIRYWADVHHIPRPRRGRAPRRILNKLKNPAFLSKQLIDQQKSGWQLARELGVNDQTVTKQMDKLGILSTKRRLFGKESSIDSVPISHQKLEELGYKLQSKDPIYMDVVSGRFFKIKTNPNRDGVLRRRYLYPTVCVCGTTRLSIQPIHAYTCPYCHTRDLVDSRLSE